MREVKKEIFFKLTKQILMSVYWAMYYVEEFGKELGKKKNVREPKRRGKKIKNSISISKTKLTTIKEKKKNDK